ncbi:hypothetical protein WMY93_003086 [Mugilogobius chulae]|uniref:Ig-like domain-containing protein n=1 Tax=Mugilogobius chulae TaxID=88201 RepID=A0AAW0PWG1_9GOBI
MLVDQKGKLRCEVKVPNNEGLISVVWMNELGEELMNNNDTDKGAMVRGREYVLELDITYEEWNEGIKRICQLKHDDEPDVIEQVFERKHDFIVDVIEQYHNWNKKQAHEEDTTQVTAMAFILLFLITLLFSIATTAFKQLSLLFSVSFLDFPCHSRCFLSSPLPLSCKENLNPAPHYVRAAVKDCHLLFTKSTTLLFNAKDPRIIAPSITLFPTWEGDADSVKPDSPVKLTCMLSDFYPDKLTVSWARDSQPLPAHAQTQKKLQSTERTPLFTLSSQIEPDMSHWQNGSSFTCTALHKDKHYSKSINICKSIPMTPPAVRLEIPNFQSVVTADSEITATCFVHSLVNASLTWLLDGSVSSPDLRVYETSNSTHVIGKLTLSPSEWKKLSVLACRAEHLCLPPTEDKTKIAAAPGPAPEVTIRRSLPHVLKGDSAVLQCDITSLSSSDFYVTFHEGTGHSISRTFSVPAIYWRTENRFRCQVSQGFSNKISVSSTKSIFVEPSVKLLLAPSDKSGQQTLSCTAWGFNPHIEWFSGSQRLSGGSNVPTSLNAEGHVVVSSSFQVPETEWKSGKVFSCQATDTSLNKKLKKDIRVCEGHVEARPVLLVEAPSFQTVMTSTSNVVKASCSLCSVFEAKISWWMDKNLVQSDSVRQYMNSSHIISELTVSPSKWKTLGHVSCKAEHVCLSTTEKTVYLLQVLLQRCHQEVLPHVLKGDSAMLQCDITNLSSSDFYVTFQCNQRDISPKDFVHLSEGTGHSISRTFSVPAIYWRTENRFRCQVSQGFSNKIRSAPQKVSLVRKPLIGALVKLLLAPSDKSGQQTLSCTAWGFNPHIEWFSGSQRLSGGSNVPTSLNAEGHVVVSSSFQVPETEWKSGKVFSCQATDTSLNKKIKKDISVCEVNLVVILFHVGALNLENHRA